MQFHLMEISQWLHYYLPWLESDSCSINISTAFYTAQFMIISVSIIGFALAIKNCGLMYYDVLQDSFLLTIT
jgi:hypothetical protein